MSWELVYTSVPQGLKPGSRGFCAVAQTRGIPAALLERLESLSGYRHLFAPQDSNARLNPPAWSHLIVNVSGKRYHLLSYVGDAGLDYSQRTNKLAHHVACEPSELTPTGPSGSLQQPGFLLTQWQSEPIQWPAGRAIPRSEIRPGQCATWQRLAGDAGWAGVLAETIYNRREVNVIFQPGMPVLNLFAEAIALLPAQKRWEATFQAFYTGLPQGVDCRWRGIVVGSNEEALARRNTNALLIDLTQPQTAPATAAANAAREGSVVEPLRTLETTPAAARPALAPQATLAPQPSAPPRARAGYPAAPQPDMNSYELQPLDGIPNSPPGLAPTWDPRFAQRVSRGKTWMIVAAVVGLIVVLGTAGGAYWIINSQTQNNELSSSHANGDKAQHPKVIDKDNLKSTDQQVAPAPIKPNPEEIKLSEETAQLLEQWNVVKKDFTHNSNIIAALTPIQEKLAKNVKASEDMKEHLVLLKLEQTQLKHFENDFKRLQLDLYKSSKLNEFLNKENVWAQAKLESEYAEFKKLKAILDFAKSHNERVKRNSTAIAISEQAISEQSFNDNFKELFRKFDKDKNFITKDIVVMSSVPITDDIAKQIRIDLINCDKSYQIKKNDSIWELSKSTKSGTSLLAEIRINAETKLLTFSPKSILLGHSAGLSSGLLLVQDTKNKIPRIPLPLSPATVEKRGMPTDLNLPSQIDVYWKYIASDSEDFKIDIDIQPVWEMTENRISAPADNQKNNDSKPVANGLQNSIQGIKAKYLLSSKIPHDSIHHRVQFKIDATRNSEGLHLNSSEEEHKLLIFKDNNQPEYRKYNTLKTMANHAEVNAELDRLPKEERSTIGSLNYEKVKKIVDTKSRERIEADNELKKDGTKGPRKAELRKKIEDIDKVLPVYNELIRLDKIWPLGYYEPDNNPEKFQSVLNSYFSNHKIRISASRIIVFRLTDSNGNLGEADKVEVPLPLLN